MSAQKQPMPLWAKLLIVLGFLGVIAIVLLVYFGVQFFTNNYPLDPVAQDKMEHSVVRIDHLPPGFERRVAMKLWDIPCIEFANRKAMLSIKVIRYSKPQWQFTGVTKEELVHRSSSVGSRLSEGTKIVAGLPMYYVLNDVPSLRSAILVGCIIPGDKVPVMISAQTSLKGKFDMEQFDQFLASIKGF